MFDMEEQKPLFVDKYAPKTLDDYILDDGIKMHFKNMVKNNALQSFSLEGVQGSGKTTLAKVIANEFNASVLFVKCATEGTVDDLRTKVEPFCNALSFDGRQKIVILDELDAASSVSGSGSGFQSGLRTLIESAQSDSKFIVTCNYVNKIIPAVLSRCPVIPLKFDKKDLLKHVKKILDSENIKYSKESVKSFIEEAFQYYPDCRRIINYLQFCCSSGELVVNLNNVANSEKNDLLDKLIKKIKTSNNILDVRKFYLSEKDTITDYVSFGSELFKYVVDNGIVVDLDGILKMTDLLFMLNQVIDKESMFFGLVTAIAKWMK